MQGKGRLSPDDNVLYMYMYSTCTCTVHCTRHCTFRRGLGGELGQAAAGGEANHGRRALHKLKGLEQLVSRPLHTSIHRPLLGNRVGKFTLAPLMWHLQGVGGQKIKWLGGLRGHEPFVLHPVAREEPDTLQKVFVGDRWRRG